MLNCTLTSRNHAKGSVGKNGGNLMLTAASVGEGAGAAAVSVASTLPSICMVGSSVVAICRESSVGLTELVGHRGSPMY